MEIPQRWWPLGTNDQWWQYEWDWCSVGGGEVYLMPARIETQTNHREGKDYESYEKWHKSKLKYKKSRLRKKMEKKVYWVLLRDLKRKNCVVNQLLGQKKEENIEFLIKIRAILCQNPNQTLFCLN